MDLRREFSNSGPSAKSQVKRLLRRVGKGRNAAQEAPVTVFEDARGPNVRMLRQAQRRLSPAELEALIAKHVARAGKTRPGMTGAQIDEAVRLYRDGGTAVGCWTLASTRSCTTKASSRPFSRRGRAARSVGWTDPFHASRCFHVAYGVSPTEYRRWQF
jgi:AraC-like DNA-binding protein